MHVIERAPRAPARGVGSAGGDADRRAVSRVHRGGTHNIDAPELRGADRPGPQVSRGLKRRRGPAGLFTTGRSDVGVPTPNHTPDDGDLADQQAAYNFERLAPGNVVSGEALLARPAAGQRAAPVRRPLAGGHQPALQRQSARLHGPVLGQRGIGFAIVGGRVTALTSPRPTAPGTPEPPTAASGLAGPGRHLVTADRQLPVTLDRRARRRPR